MYCTLQEAYNIPSFANKKKKGCTNPIGKISADSYEPYDPYTADSGKERALTLTLSESQNSQPKNGTVSHELNPPIDPLYAQNYQNIQRQMEQDTASNREQAGIRNTINPIWPTRFSSQNQPVVEKFSQYGKPPPAEQTMNDIPYNVQSGDYKYYCDSFGICTTPKVEPFANPPSSGYQSQSQNVPPSNRYPSVPQRQSPGIMLSLNGPPTDGEPGEIQMPYYGPKPMGKCGSLQAPSYQLPISDETKAQSQKILNDSLDQQQGASENWPYPMRRVDMSKVSGYYDEDLENFLTTQQLKNAPLPPPSNLTNIHQTEDSQYNLEQDYEQKINTQRPKEIHDTDLDSQSSSTKYPQTITSIPSSLMKRSDPHQYIMDLLLFISLGILIILLCDQIFKLGMSYGMKDTVHILMPYLKELKINEV